MFYGIGYGWGFAGLSAWQSWGGGGWAARPYDSAYRGMYSLAGAWFQQGVSPGYEPYTPLGGKAEGYGPTTWQRGGYVDGYSAGHYSYSRTPIYEYEKAKAVDYKFQLGQKFHNVDVQRQVQTRRIDPIILDLNNDGKLDITPEDHSTRNVNQQTSRTVQRQRRGRTLTTTTTTRREWDTLKDWNHKIDFDVDGDGRVERTQWLKKGSQDGFLVYDANQDGKITGNELMNEGGLDGKANAYKNGWEKALALGDKNRDGVLRGDELKGFSVWQDADGDGVTDAGELKTLAELGITEINAREGSFTRRKEVGYTETYHSFYSQRVV